MDSLVKVFFQFQPDADGWPPVSVESVWAKPGNVEDEYILANVPFFTRDATLDDTVQVREAEGVLWFAKVVRDSTNSLLRIIVTDPTAIEEINNRVVALGCNTEIARNFKLITVNVPASIRLSALQDYLKTQEDAGLLGYEEAILKQ